MRPRCDGRRRQEESLERVTLPFLFSAAPTALLTSESCPDGGAAPGVAQVNDNPQPNVPFAILAAVGLEYQTLSKTVTQALRSASGTNGPLQLPFKPLAIQVGDAHGQVFVQVELRESLRGTISFWGTPVLSEDHKTISIPGLHLAADSRGALFGLNVRLPDAIVNLFQPRLARALVFDVEQLTRPLAGTNGKAISFSFPGGRVSLSNLRVAIESVQSVPSQLRINATLAGRAAGSVFMQP